MSFPIINYKYNGIAEGERLSELVDQKLAPFSKYLHGSEAVTCDVEFEKVAEHHQGNIFRVEVNLLIDGTLYRAEATEESFEKAIDEMRNELDKELRRAKDKQVSMDKRAGREAKEQMLNNT